MGFTNSRNFFCAPLLRFDVSRKNSKRSEILYFMCSAGETNKNDNVLINTTVYRPERSASGKSQEENFSSLKPGLLQILESQTHTQ